MPRRLRRQTRSRTGNSSRHPLRRVTLRIASTLYDDLRPAALFRGFDCALKELVLVLAPDVDMRTRGRQLGTLANTGAGLEILEMRLEGTSERYLATPLRSASLDPVPD